jgi:hypothetical protein
MDSTIVQPSSKGAALVNGGATPPPPRATVLAPPVSPDDKTTTRGAGKVILRILLLFGLLVPTVSTAIQGKVQAVQLPADYQKRWLVLVGDGLSQMRLQAFKDMLHTSSYSFEKWYEMAQLLSKALDQCVALPGDLHGGGFHFLVVVYNLYYGGIIQPIQTALGWKQICGKDITQCYQPAGGGVSYNDTARDRTAVVSCLLGNDCSARRFEA